ELVVLFAVTGRDVHEPGARVHRDERRRRDLAPAIEPRVTVLESLEPSSRNDGESPRGAETRDLREAVGELRGDDETLAADLVHRLEALVDEPLADESPELERDHRLVGGRHRDVRIVPVAKYAQSLELLALDLHVLRRVGTALADLLERIHRAPNVGRGLVESDLLVDLMLDRQAVTVPARHVHGVEGRHPPRLPH